jgi:hypothetical protein
MSEIVEGVKQNSDVNDSLEDFNLNEFTVSPIGQTAAVRKVILQVPVKKPNKQKFFKVLSGSEWETCVSVIEMKEDNEFYIVKASAIPYVQSETKLVRLHLAYYMDGTPFLIPVPLPDADGKWNSWNRSLDAAVKAGTNKWVRAIADKASGGYILMEAIQNYPDPKLPEEMKMSNYIEIAFRGRIIGNPDHPLIMQLAGKSVVG